MVLSLGWYDPPASLRTWHNDKATDLSLDFRRPRDDWVSRFDLATLLREHDVKPTGVAQGRSRLVVAELPIGTYNITHWRLETNASELLEPSHINPIEFVVEPERAIYIGAYLVELSRAKGWLNTTNIVHAQLNIRDEYQRDRNRVAIHYPGVATKPISASVPTRRSYPSPVLITAIPEVEEEAEDE